MDIYDLWLSKAAIPFNKKLELYNKFKGAENLWYYIFKNTNNRYEQNEILRILKSSYDLRELEVIENSIYKSQVQTVKIGEDKYPKSLSVFDDAPFMLFYKGNIDELNSNRCVAVVGSRNASNYGRHAALSISSELTKHGVNVVSGMAKGIDAYAHESSLKNNGYTCAVLGSGIDVIYPKENRALYSDICEKGCIISEYVPGTPPYKFNFPARNRIISGLCEAVVVVEAGKKSGSLITAGIAINQGKDVLAVPGSIFANESIGTNQLIKDGAKPYTGIQDIFVDIELENIVQESCNIDEKYKKIITVIKDTPIHIDDIIRLTNIDIKRLYELLFELQLKNEIMCLAGNYYVRLTEKLCI